MSGTSVDGLDIAICEFINNDNKWSFNIIEAVSYDYPSNIRRSLIGVSAESAVRIIEIENEFTIFAAKKVSELISKTNIKPQLIASHGHTVFHRPAENYTFQIGNGELLAKKTGIQVVCDFRRGDVALGGQGAPLVPIGDKLLFEENSACLNLGGFSNISFDDISGKRIAFDISPLNILLNKYARSMGKEYDEDGKIARSGKLNIDLMAELSDLKYYTQKYPKSLSIEWVKNFVEPLLSRYSSLSTCDMLCTLTNHMADIIATELSMHKDVLITGGGVYNKFLMSLIKEKTTCKIIIPDKTIIEFKEALIFAFLGILRLKNENNVLCSVTGAERDSCCGLISIP